MDHKKQQSMRMVWLEIGLAVLLAVVLGVGGAWLTGRDTVQKESKNEQNRSNQMAISLHVHTLIRRFLKRWNWG